MLKYDNKTKTAVENIGNRLIYRCFGYYKPNPLR